MFFNKKDKKIKEKCNNCKSNLEEEFSYCPYCGLHLLDGNKELEDFGMLGRNDFSDRNTKNALSSQTTSGFSDKIIGSLMNSLVKSLDKQFKDMNKDFSNAEIHPMPNGFSIKIGPANANQVKQEKPKRETSSKKGPTTDQLKKISQMPRTQAVTNVKRLGNKIVYELSMQGIKSPEDIFVSKLENGYEIKAIGDKQVYVNTIPLDLPVKTFKIDKDKITVEFKTDF